MTNKYTDKDKVPSEKPVSSDAPTQDTFPPLGNTLDFYNDSMSRKAVGKLFDEDLDTAEENTGLGGTEEDLEAPADIETVKDEVFSALEDVRKTEEEYDFSIFKAKEKRTEPKEIEPELEDLSPPPKKSVKLEEPDLEEVPVNILTPQKKVVRNYNQPQSKHQKIHMPDDIQPEGQGAPVKTRPKERTLYYRHNIYDDINKEEEPLSARKPVFYIAVGGFVVLLFVLTFLTFKLNSLNKDYEAALEVADTIAEYVEREQTYLIEIESLREQVNSLTVTPREPEVPAEDEPNENGEEPVGQESGETGTTATPPASSPSPAPDSATERYTVVSGDTLSRISEKVYGTSYDYDRIMEANNMTENDYLQEGQVLTIPR